MIRYTVVWLALARNQLAHVWLESTDRDASTRASAEIDRELAVDPESKGDIASDLLRSLRAAPREAAFHVRELDRIVEVVAVRLLPRELW
jgi:hypothetical protein